MSKYKIVDYSRIQKLFKNQPLTQADFAIKAGISVNSVRNVLNNKNITIETLEKFSIALDVPMIYWFQKEDLVMHETKPTYEKKSSMEIEKLNSWISVHVETIRRLNLENEELREKLGLKKEGTSGL